MSLILVGVMHRFFSSQYQGYLLQGDLLEIQQQARIGTDLFSRELRMAAVILEASTGSDPRSPTHPPLIHFLADRNGNGLLAGPDDPDEDLRYRFVPSSNDPPAVFERRSGNGVGQPVISHLEGMRLVYLLADGTERPDESHPAPYSLDEAERRQIREIRLTLTIRTERFNLLRSQNRGYRLRTFSTVVRPRNL
jgi:hypothetical protein